MVTYRFRLRSESEFKIDSQGHFSVCIKCDIHSLLRNSSLYIYIYHLLMLLVLLTEVTAVQTVVCFVRGFAVIQLVMQKILK